MLGVVFLISMIMCLFDMLLGRMNGYYLLCMIILMGNLKVSVF